MELFDASGMEGTSSAASNLADALASLAKPLQEISANTAKTAQSATQDMRPNSALEDFMSGSNQSVTGFKTEEQRNAEKAASEAAILAAKEKKAADKEAAAEWRLWAQQAKIDLAAQRKDAKELADLAKAAKIEEEKRLKNLARPGGFLAQPLSAKLPTAQNVGNLPTASRMANVVSSSRAGGAGAGGGNNKVLAAAGSLAGNLGRAGSISGALAAVGSFAAKLGPAGAAVAAVGAAAIGVPLALKSLVTSIVSVSANMTEAFDPLLVDRFNLALRDSRAVFGSILYPVVQQATRVVKAFADTVFNTGSELTASVKTLAKSFGDLAVASLPFVNSMLKVFAAQLTNVAEFTRTLADFLGPQITSFTAIFNSLAVSWRSGLGSMLSAVGGTRASLTQLGQAFAKANIIITAWAYRLMGMNGALGALQKSLADGAAGTKKDATGLAAAQNARTMGVAELGKSVLQQAFIATGRADDPADLTTEEFQQQLLEEVQYISGGDWKEDLKAVLIEIVGEVMSAPGKAIDKLAEETARQVGGDYGAGVYQGARQSARSAVSQFTFGIL